MACTYFAARSCYKHWIVFSVLAVLLLLAQWQSNFKPFQVLISSEGYQSSILDCFSDWWACRETWNLEILSFQNFAGKWQDWPWSDSNLMWIDLRILRVLCLKTFSTFLPFWWSPQPLQLWDAPDPSHKLCWQGLIFNIGHFLCTITNILVL